MRRNESLFHQTIVNESLLQFPLLNNRIFADSREMLNLEEHCFVEGNLGYFTIYLINSLLI
jgi:hypothetical protein